ncbi:MAG: Cd(II)/Pb(II)-responsive transcriptional regulator [Gammaproteobacteria bacterium]|nr:MAG: Cd(II)/Pb(II)-responsive transcriptional regulator [Gammaproteobacteria bacterium]
MKIGELAKVSKCTTETIRYYEKSGLLPAPERSVSNYRLYNQIHKSRLNFIRNCRSLAMSHDEIRSLLALMDKPPEDCSDVNHLLDDHIKHVDTRLHELMELKAQLSHLQQQCQNEDVIDHCGILRGLQSMENIDASHSHLK